MDTGSDQSLRQHLIDPQTCIRCNTCETRCPSKAISHRTNYVIDPALCNGCLRCIRPCPTGAIENWRMVDRPYSLTEQHAWAALPPVLEPGAAALPEAFDDEARAVLDTAHGGSETAPRASPSASRPQINLYTREHPAKAVVAGNLRITSEGSASDVHHIILDFGIERFPYLEGQSLGLVPPGRRPDGEPHAMRVYSIASARDGERPNTNNLALAVKRIEATSGGGAPVGIASNWLCDLAVGEEVDVVGPFGSTFLMPDDPEADLLMICTGTGVSPFRGFTHRRRRTAPDGPGRLFLFYGARSADELPYFGPLQGYAQSELHRELVYSRSGGSEREYVQDRLRSCAVEIATLLRKPKTHIYVCGLRGLEDGVDAAMSDIGRHQGIDWVRLRSELRARGQFHIEVY